MGSGGDRDVVGSLPTKLSRLAILSMHTSPLTQPGTGDAGGMNVYIAKSATALAELGVDIDIYTLEAAGHCASGITTDSDPRCDEVIWHTTIMGSGIDAAHEVSDAVAAVPRAVVPRAVVRVHSLSLAGTDGVSKEDLPAHIDAWADAVAAHIGDVQMLHSHYWLSGLAGLRIARSLNLPLVHTMHTIAAVKNAHADAGDVVEPASRVRGEELIATTANQLTANTGLEAADLVTFCGAAADTISLAPPGVDLSTFAPGDMVEARQQLGLPKDAFVITFIGRLQRHKAPDLAIRALAALREVDPILARRAVLVICGGRSGTAGYTVESLAQIALELGVLEQIHFMEPMPPAGVAILYQASDVVVMPSASESFGLVALEAQACGTPVITTAVGGLTMAVADGSSGFLIDSREPVVWAQAISRVAAPQLREQMSQSARSHASHFTWQRTAQLLLNAYQRALQ